MSKRKDDPYYDTDLEGRWRPTPSDPAWEGNKWSPTFYGEAPPPDLVMTAALRAAVEEVLSLSKVKEAQ